MRIEKLPLGPLSTNCYIAWENKKAIIIDPSAEAQAISQKVSELDIQPLAILLTHAHFDHIGALEEVRTQYNIPVYIHPVENDWLTDPALNGSDLFGFDPVTAKPADYFVEDNELTIGEFNIEVRHTPGHSPGGVAYILPKHDAIFGGDSLFAGGIGRTDLPGGDFSELEHSIKTQLYSLPDSFKVYPGHGPNTTIKDEKENNPFISN